MTSNRTLKVAGPEESRLMLIGALNNEEGAARDIVILNAGATLYAANLVDSIASGIQLARATIASGAARAKLDQFVSTTQTLGRG